MSAGLLPISILDTIASSTELERKLASKSCALFDDLWHTKDRERESERERERDRTTQKERVRLVKEL